MRWRRVESGLYESSDGRWQVERIDSYAEWDVAQVVWVVNEKRDDKWIEEVHEADTMRECKMWAESQS